MTENLQAVLRKALDITKSVQIPAHLEPIAFGKIIDLLTTGPIVGRKENSAAPLVDLQHQGAQISEESTTQKVAAKLGLDPSVVEQVLSSDATKGIEVIIGAGRLEPTKKVGSQQIAILVAGGRQLAGLEEWTSTKLIREVCQNYGKFDSDNFARDIKELHDFFGFRGKGRMTEIKINRPGTEGLGALISRLTESAH
jgi:hypothetical protein